MPLICWVSKEFEIFKDERLRLLGMYLKLNDFSVDFTFFFFRSTPIFFCLFLKRKVALILTTKYRKRTLFQFSHKNMIMFHGVERYIAHSPDDICQKFSRSQTYPLSITFWARRQKRSDPVVKNFIQIIGNYFGKISPWS